MKISDIPARSLTHLYFSFGFITPDTDTFGVVPMPNTSHDLFRDVAAIKKDNPDLKVLIALGGWGFNDNNTVTQPVFHDLVSKSSARKNFIANLLIFLRGYGFDGVDFDWEYPGASDRGGGEYDGENLALLLKELKQAIAKDPADYLVSFTAPTSYWYLRHFTHLAEYMDHVDWVNVMTYDLHGVWDSDSSIGSHVLAHTNLTGIKEALNLFWRNDIDPAKVNLGLGFYGRSFQLADPSCNTPGCLFKGGGAPGECTGSSGTLSYREIMAIMDK
ncbi:putative glycosyl hydrolases family 18 protein [Lasiodiplodia theobromae]|nr:putative glycosyl hydrolases family 18 protein [Lasiodiplodia theobromae]